MKGATLETPRPVVVETLPGVVLERPAADPVARSPYYAPDPVLAVVCFAVSLHVKHKGVKPSFSTTTVQKTFFTIMADPRRTPVNSRGRSRLQTGPRPLIHGCHLNQ